MLDNTIDQCDQSHKVGCHQGQIETSPNQSYHIGKWWVGKHKFERRNVEFASQATCKCEKKNLQAPKQRQNGWIETLIGAILSKLGEDNSFHPIGFYFHKFSLVEINYNIHEKEALIIVDAFKEWCHLLKGIQHEILCI
jgi:hypothetical protein